MATAEEKGKRPRVGDDGDERMDDALMLSIEKLQQIQDEIEKVSRFVSQRDSRQSTPVVARRGCSGIRFGCRPFRFRFGDFCTEAARNLGGILLPIWLGSLSRCKAASRGCLIWV
jgi:hypothetical protein